jgi:hypothetical protein
MRPWVILGLVILVALVIGWRVKSASRATHKLAFFDSAPIPERARADTAFIDDFLARFDRFAQGENELLPALRYDIPRFNAEIVLAVHTDPHWATSRAIMYPILQVGGFVPVVSPYGVALASIFRDSGPQPTQLRGEQFYFAGDLYLWWEQERTRYAPFQLYDEWRNRDFARNVVIPRYTRLPAK